MQNGKSAADTHLGSNITSADSILAGTRLPGSSIDTEGILEWKSHLLKQNPLKSIFPIAISVLFCVAVWLMMEEWIFVLISALVLFLSMLRFYFPVRYRLDGEGISIWFLGFRKFRRWSDFRNVYVHQNGLFLSPFEKPSRLDPFRGLNINYNNNRDSVVAFAREQLNIA